MFKGLTIFFGNSLFSKAYSSSTSAWNSPAPSYLKISVLSSNIYIFSNSKELDLIRHDKCHQFLHKNLSHSLQNKITFHKYCVNRKHLNSPRSPLIHQSILSMFYFLLFSCAYVSEALKFTTQPLNPSNCNFMFYFPSFLCICIRSTLWGINTAQWGCKISLLDSLQGGG